MNETEYYRRIAALRPPELAQRRVLLVGAGSLGGRVAAELVRLGISLHILDRPGELLEEHNLVRHVLGYEALGQPKLAALRRHLAGVNPAAAVTTAECDVVEDHERLQQELTTFRPDLICVGTDNEPSKHAVNAAAREVGVPAVVFAAVFDAGVGGEIFIGGTSGACYACFAAHIGLPAERTRREVDVDYNNSEQADLASTPALNMDIEQIALLQSRVAYELLCHGNLAALGLDPRVNYLLFGNRVFPGVFARPLGTHFRHFARRQRCFVCGGQPANSQDVDVANDFSEILRQDLPTGVGPRL